MDNIDMLLCDFDDAFLASLLCDGAEEQAAAHTPPEIAWCEKRAFGA
jgi:hypothetical protein